MLCLGPLARAFVGRLCRGRSLQQHRGLLERAEHWIHFSECILELLDALGTCEHHLLFIVIVQQQKGKKERRGGERAADGGCLFAEYALNIELGAACRYHVVSQTNCFRPNRYVTVRPARRNTATTTPDRVHNSPESDQTSRHVNVCRPCCLLPPSPLPTMCPWQLAASKPYTYLPRYKDEEADLRFCQAVNQPGEQLRFVVAEATVCRGNETFQADRKAKVRRGHHILDFAVCLEASPVANAEGE